MSETTAPDSIGSTLGAPNTARASRKRDRTRWYFIGPAIIWILLFTLFPLLYAIRTSFYAFRSGKMLRWVGFDNYRNLWEDEALRSDLQRTIVYVTVVVVVEMVLGFLLALLFNRQMRGVSSLRTIMVLPLFASPIALGYLGKTIFYEIDGPVNRAIEALGGNGIPWLSDPTWAFVAIMIVDIWQWTPFVFLVSLAGLQALPQDITEAAEVDGASALQRLFSITLPLMAPILWLILLLRTIDAFKVVDIVISMTLGGPGRATELYGFYVFRTARRFFNYGSAAAQGYLLLVIVMILVSLLWGRIRNLYEHDVEAR
ncbi:MAG TPA: sugar ABC transporter permease [Thermomicrobiales bacterium]|nr:sugar ABC transporter permease [Thermomicrobiales bacterium]